VTHCGPITATMTSAARTRSSMSRCQSVPGCRSRVSKKTLSALAADPAKLKAVLLYHVAQGKVTAAQVSRRSSITTLEGATVRIKVTGRTVKVNNARVVKPDVAASNGVIHAINRVLIPPAG